jgi:hypothetical protein
MAETAIGIRGFIFYTPYKRVIPSAALGAKSRKLLLRSARVITKSRSLDWRSQVYPEHVEGLGMTMVW